MKFSKILASHLTPEWRSQYIDYEGLKEILYNALQVMSSSNSPNLIFSIELEFFDLSKENLTKINTFFVEKLSECNRRHHTLQIALNSFRRKSMVTPKLMKKINKKIQQLHAGFMEQYLNLTLLRNYQSLNVTGFRKIMKKHDKIFENKKGQIWFEKSVMTADFATNNEIADLMNQTVEIVANEFHYGDKSMAMKRLRVPPLHDEPQPGHCFITGFLIGISVILLFAGYLGPPIEPKADFEAHLKLFAPLVYIIIYLYCLSCNIIGWRKAGVNHVLIFELNPRNYLSFIEVLEIASLIFLIYTSHLVAFVYHQRLNAPRYIFPLLMNIATILFLINPLPIFYRKTRFWVLIALGRIMVTPLFFVKFPDFWIADQLCSLADVFAGALYFICFYCTINDWNYVTGTKMCDSSGELFWLFMLMKACPYWFRFAQCIRRYRHMPSTVGLINATKYLWSLLSGVLSATEGYYVQKYSQPLTNPFTICWFIVNFISSVFSVLYDIIMDWGFLEGCDTCLRSQLVYSPKYVYYLAVTENILFRFLWIPFFYLKAVKKIAPNIIPYIQSSCEIFRRCVWNFFRLENEHINNVGKYRAVRDISI